jgi:hypothetical protein
MSARFTNNTCHFSFVRPSAPRYEVQYSCYSFIFESVYTPQNIAGNESRTNMCSLLQRGPHTRHLILLLQNIWQRPNRRDLILIDLSMTLCIMLLDMFKLGRVLERRYIPVQMAHPLMQRRVSRANIANVALEVLHVHGVEADNRCEQANVGFSDGGRGEEVGCGGLGEVGFEAVQGFEEGCYGLGVGFFGTRV